MWTALQPLFQPGHFFAPQQVHFAAPTSSNKPSQESSKEKAKGKTKPKPKAADWSVEETKHLLHAWAPCFERLKGSSTRMCTAIWNEIYEDFKSSCDESERTLLQVKKRQQNLEYEFKQLKLKSSKTGKEGLNKIKENFPYYSIFDETMGYRDSVDPPKMNIESSSFVPSVSDAVSTPQPTSSGAKERKESSASTARKTTTNLQQVLA